MLHFEIGEYREINFINDLNGNMERKIISSSRLEDRWLNSTASKLPNLNDSDTVFKSQSGEDVVT